MAEGNAPSLLRAADIPGEAGETEVPVKISGFSETSFDGQPKKIVMFEGKEKAMALNVTNAQTLGRKANDNRLASVNTAKLKQMSVEDFPQNLIGTEWILYTEWTKFQDNPVLGLRIKPAIPKVSEDVSF